MTNKQLYYKIAQNGGIYNGKKYRYDIDTNAGIVRRIESAKLDTTAAIEPNAWKTLFTVKSIK